MTRDAASLYIKDHSLAAQQIGQQLKAGTLTLFLGAGISAGLGLPTWVRLVKDVVSAAGLSERITKKCPNETLRTIMEKVERDHPKEYRNWIRASLYAKAADDDMLMQRPLLSVLGAMLVPSARGHVREVLTLNFDDMLERYLLLYGYDVQPVTELPCLIRNADVAVYHAHGFLPSAQCSALRESSELVFSQLSYDLRAAERGRWRDVAMRLLLNHNVVWVGVSASDPTWGPLLEEAKAALQGTREYFGFWLLGPDDSQDDCEQVQARSAIPLKCDDYDAYWRLLLQACRVARSGGSLEDEN